MLGQGTHRVPAEGVVHSVGEWFDIVDAIRDPVFIHDIHGHLLRANRAYFEQAGTTDVLGKPYWEVFPRAAGPLPNCARSLGSCHDFADDEIVSEQGKVFRSRAFTRRDAGDRFLWAVHILEDITAQRAAEAELLRVHAALEQRVVDRTAELAAANAELESFAYSVAHDLRSPLRAIDGFSRLLLDAYENLLDGTGKDYLARVRHGVQRMGRLIDDLLRMSRVTRAELVRDTVDLSALAERAAQDLRLADPVRNICWSIEPGLAVSADGQLLRVVLDNLLGNAWKFTGQRAEAAIAVGAYRGDHGQPVYFVRDNGAGFDMRYVDKLFGPFQRLHAIDEFPGSGIGLATVQRIVQRHGGRVWAEAAIDQGATFYFTLDHQAAEASQ